MKVAFIGLGQMGSRMSRNLIKKGITVQGFDVNQGALDTIAKLGGIPKDSPASAAEGCDAVITMLPTSKHVENAYLGDNGIIHSLTKGSLCIDSSTIDPQISMQVHDNIVAKDCEFCDAPVSGGVGGAEAGTLTFMLGGTKESCERAKPILERMGKNVVHCGKIGTGEVAKLCNNLVLAVSMLGVSEAMNLGSKFGIDRQVLASIINSSTGRCWSSDTYNPAPGVLENVPSANEYSGGFGTSLMLKDLGLVSEAAKSNGIPIPMGDRAHAFYDLMVSRGFGSKDFSVAFKFLGGTDEDPK